MKYTPSRSPKTRSPGITVAAPMRIGTLIKGWNSNPDQTPVAPCSTLWCGAIARLVSAGRLFGRFLRHPKIRNFDRIAIHIASQLDRVPSMLGQSSEILIFDAVHFG